MMEYLTPKGLIPFITELKALNILRQDDNTNIALVSEILARWVVDKEWLDERFYYVNPEVGFNSWLIHEEKDHTLAVNIVAWQSGREITPHDHQTWGVVGSIIGVEKNYFWKRMDDGSKPGYAEIIREKTAVIRPAGGVIGFLPNDIHSVINESDDVAISLHVYGKNLNYTGRHQYDPVNNLMQPFIVNYS
ncbi:cupin [Legionella pneumophila]|nr:cupin [Legionella pneumophila]MCZ4677632.1 cupin [Legionella pneumophila]MCZ4703001.1 cupin [Legionella pneumophila]MCZ4737751.1 cupin [Legionella pneumophila]MCZ4748659.1 cupin [Legionella pneumophila]MDI9828758.1 cupin [Legionella pneumophila]